MIWLVAVGSFVLGLVVMLAVGAFMNRTPRHVHDWTPWQRTNMVQINNLTGRSVGFMGMARQCRTCGDSEKKS